MSKQLEVNHQSLLDAYFDYYKAKLSSREHFENIIKIDNDQYEYDHFVIENNAELILKDSFNPIQNLLFLFRSNPHYITTLVSILDEKMAHDAAKTNPSLDSIVNLFCHQFYDNILSIMKNYICENIPSLYENFSELNQKKDVMTGYFKKELSEEMSIIASNIYDVTDFIFTKLDGSTALTYCDKDNLAAVVIKKLLNEGNVSDDFLTAIADIYKNNVNLRSRIGFEIVFAIKNGEIKDLYKLPKNDQ